MSPEEWAEVFKAGWDDSNITKHEPAGDAVAKALASMESKCREIAQRHAS